ncbi:LOW QUALITY PROTEIN: FAR1 domain-containing protein, partial [Cephalotus follicularis]
LNQEFDNLDDVYTFYNCYALHKGFGVRKSSSSKSSATGELIWKKFVCDKASWRVKNKEKVDGSEAVSRCRETRDGCMTSLNVRWRKHGKWVVTGFVEEHCHTLDTPRRAGKHRSIVSHKSSAAKDLMEQLHTCGMGPSVIAKAINIMGNITDISTDHVINHLRKHRMNNIGIEDYLVAMHFTQQMRLDSNSYFTAEYESDGTLRSMFWVDARSREEYFVFSDVIVFYVTYKTTKFMMPFASFTGVNHHKQSESIISFFDGFDSNTHLPEFVEQYDRALMSRRQAEERKNYWTMTSNPKLITRFPFEQAAAGCYTAIMFKLFQADLHESLSCWYEMVRNQDAITKYIAGLCDEDKRKWWTIVYDESECVTLKCECVKFETEGYLCRHTLDIMQERHITVILEQYMLKRWTIRAKYTMDAGVSTSNVSENNVTPIMEWGLTTLFTKAAHKASSSTATYNEYHSWLNGFMGKFNELRLTDNQFVPSVGVRSEVGSIVISSDMHGISIRDPQVVRTKGRPKIAS